MDSGTTKGGATIDTGAAKGHQEPEVYSPLSFEISLLDATVPLQLLVTTKQQDFL